MKIHKPKILYLDIETRKMTVKTFTLYPKFIPATEIEDPGGMLCWAAKFEGGTVEYRRQGDPDFLTKLHDMVDEADIIVHYYGSSFDMKHINREFLAAGLDPPSHYQQIDLKKVIKRHFNFPSYKLDYVCQALGIGCKVKHMGSEMWDLCDQGDKKAWRMMEKYNKQDTKLLPALYKRVRPWISNHPNTALYVEDPDKPICPTCQSTKVVRKGTQVNKGTGSYERFKCGGCGAPLRSRIAIRKTSPHVLARS